MIQRTYKPKCSVWQYWNLEDDSDGRPVARCKFCSREYTSSAAKNATRLRQHLTRRCLLTPEEVKQSFPEDFEERTKLKTSIKTEDNTTPPPKRLASLRVQTLVKYEIGAQEEEVEEEDQWQDSPIESNNTKDKQKDFKTLEDENCRLSTKLKICTKQKETLIQINKYLDKSLQLMQRLDQLYKCLANDNDPEVRDLTDQLNISNDSVKEWKQKYDLIEYNHKLKTMLKTTGPMPSKDVKSITGKGHRPQSTIWQYFDIISKESDSFKTIRCKFCQKEFRYKQLNATKCRTHIVENCDNVPEEVKDEENNWIEYRPQSKVEIWQHFSITEDTDKTTVQCLYCGRTYSGRNATKCRKHIVAKCEQIPEDIRNAIVDQCDEDFVNTSQSVPKSKISNIWIHFDVEEYDGKTSCVCIYCRHIFTYKNATKSRRHLIDKCPAIPEDIRKEIDTESGETGRTWTQTKIPILDHFETNTIDGKESLKCIYCGFTYSRKNATKLRMHLLLKCNEIPDECRERISDQCKESYLNGLQNKSEINIKYKKVRKVYTKKDPFNRSGGRPKCSVWDHFSRESEEDTETIRFKCLYCFQSFNYRNATKMRQHLAISCDFCPEETKNLFKELDDGSVRPYKRRIKLPEMHECCWPGCDMKFAKLSRLRNHQLSHMGVQSRIKCDWPGCEWTGRAKADVKIHRCIHTGEKPYVCDWPGCDFKTAKPSSLWVHKRRHKELFKFPCDWPGCERRFLTAWERKRHKNTHLGIKPFGCQFCDKRYPTAYKLKVHQNKHHSNGGSLIKLIGIPALNQ